MPNIVEDKAIVAVKKYLRKKKYDIEDVSKGKRRNSEHRGYDLIASKPERFPSGLK